MMLLDAERSEVAVLLSHSHNAANHEIAERNSQANSILAVRLNILLCVSACQFFN